MPRTIDVVRTRFGRKRGKKPRSQCSGQNGRQVENGSHESRIWESRNTVFGSMQEEDCIHNEHSQITVRADTQTAYSSHCKECVTVLLIIIFGLWTRIQRVVTKGQGQDYQPANGVGKFRVIIVDALGRRTVITLPERCARILATKDVSSAIHVKRTSWDIV